MCQPPFTRQSVKLFLQISRGVSTVWRILILKTPTLNISFGFFVLVSVLYGLFLYFFFFLLWWGSFVLGLSLKTPSTIRCVVHLPDFGVTLQSAFLRRERKLGVSLCPALAALLLSHSHSHLRSHLQFCLQFFVKVDSQLCCCCYIKRTKSCK